MGPLATLSLFATPPLAALLALAWLAPPTRSPLFDTLAVAAAAAGVILAGLILLGRERRLRDALATTERRQSDQAAALAAAHAELARASAARRTFLATVGHELRTPMTAIIGMTRLALDSELTTRQREWLLRVDRAAQQLKGQIEDILDYVRAESGTIPLLRQAFRLDDVLAGVLARTRAAIGDKDLQLHLERDPAVPAVLLGDGRRLAQVLGALADNSAKFTEAGEVVIGARLLHQDTDSVEIECEVRDSGSHGDLGGPDSQTLFDAFTQADESLSRRHGGAGLGLGLCRQLVARMDGRLQVISLPGVGTRVTVRLRFGLAKPAAAGSGRPIPGAGTTAAWVANRDGDPSATSSPAIGIHFGPARRHGDSEQRQRQLLRRFVVDQVGFIDDYRALYADGDRAGAARLARDLTNAAASLGARGLAATASRIARMRRADDDPGPLLEQVADELGMVINAVTEALNQPAPTPAATTMAGQRGSSPPPAAGTRVGPGRGPGPTEAATGLNELAGLLAEFDAAAINAFARLRPLLERLGPDAQLESLQQDINGFDFSRALPRVFEFARAAGIDLAAAALASAPATACAAGQRLH